MEQPSPRLASRVFTAMAVIDGKGQGSEGEMLSDICGMSPSVALLFRNPIDAAVMLVSVIVGLVSEMVLVLVCRCVASGQPLSQQVLPSKSPCFAETAAQVDENECFFCTSGGLVDSGSL